jgi:hypothetical protein
VEGNKENLIGAKILEVAAGNEVGMPGYDFVLNLEKDGFGYIVQLSGSSDYGPANFSIVAHTS